MAPSDSIAAAGTGLGAAAAPARRDPALTLAVGTAVLVMLIIQAGLVLKGNASVLNGVLFDPDGYMRLARVEHLWATGAWFDPVFPRIGPPEGLALHWTRPFDVLLLAGALIASPLLGFKAGLYWWGAFLGPVLQVASVAALVWAAAPLLRRAWLCLLAFLYVGQPFVFAMFAVGRPDHHGLQILLFILLIGFTLRLLFDPGWLRPALWAGLVSALAVWISVESILPVALSIAALGLSWVLGEARALRVLRRHAVTVCLALIAMLLVERGAGALSGSEIDRLSAAHLSVFLINLAFWLFMSLLDRRGLLGRGAMARGGAAAVTAAAALFLLWLAQPGLFANPMTGGDPLYMAENLANIEELQPVLDLDAALAGPWYEAANKPILWLGIVLLAAPWLVYRLLASAGRERLAWAFIALGTVVFLPLAAGQLRWVFYPEILLLIPYAAFAGAVLDRIAKRMPEQVVGVLRPLLVAALCVWFYVPSAVSDSGPRRSESTRTATTCPIRSLAEVLNDPAGLGARPRTVFALVDFGPELLYRTPHSVLAIPNHRLQPGFAAGYRAMTASDFAEAERRLRAARVDLVLVCPDSAESWFYDTDGSARTLNEALRADDPPAFLRPLALPAPLSEHFKLFALRPSAE